MQKKIVVPNSIYSKDRGFNRVYRKHLFKRLSGYGYILPILIIIISFYVIPIFMSLGLSFTKYNILKPPKYFGLKNYAHLLKDKIFIQAVKNTIIFAAGVVPLQTMLSMILAVCVTRKGNTRFAQLIKGMIFIPAISSFIVIGIVWRIILNGDTSPLNFILSIFGTSAKQWLGNSRTALPTLMMIYIWKNVGYFMVIFISGLMDIPKSYYEAAQVDGAGKWIMFKNVTLPLLKPTTIMVIFLSTIWSMQNFGLVYTVTGGGPGTATMTLVLHTYMLVFQQFNSGYAMAVANVLFFIIACMSILQKKLLRRDKSVY